MLSNEAHLRYFLVQLELAIDKSQSSNIDFITIDLKTAKSLEIKLSSILEKGDNL